MNIEDTTTQDRIKKIIINSKLSSNIIVEDAEFIIKAYIFAKKNVDLEVQPFEQNMFDVNLLLNAFQYASSYFENKFTLKTIIKADKHIPNKNHIVKVWF